jgi:hypothetical protein
MQDAPVCAGEHVTATPVPLDMFVMLDRSTSMLSPVSGGQTEWQAATSALATFVQEPSLTEVSIGLQYFGLSATTGAPDSCNAADYASAAVEIAPLPGVATQIAASIAAHSPTTGTPTSAALQGAINHSTAWAHAHPGHASVVVLATDGVPKECDVSLADVDSIAAAGVTATPKILTAVIGVGGQVPDLNGIAAAGGTSHAYLVDTGGNVDQQFLDAMNAIHGAALACTYQIPVPTSGTPDYHRVNVTFTPGTGTPETFPYVMNRASCPASGNAWYYDDPANPTQILLCDSTCTFVQGDAAGQISITLGCATIVF